MGRMHLSLPHTSPSSVAPMRDPLLLLSTLTPTSTLTSMLLFRAASDHRADHGALNSHALKQILFDFVKEADAPFFALHFGPNYDDSLEDDDVRDEIRNAFFLLLSTHGDLNAFLEALGQAPRWISQHACFWAFDDETLPARFLGERDRGEHPNVVWIRWVPRRKRQGHPAWARRTAQRDATPNRLPRRSPTVSSELLRLVHTFLRLPECRHSFRCRFAPASPCTTKDGAWIWEGGDRADEQQRAVVDMLWDVRLSERTVAFMRTYFSAPLTPEESDILIRVWRF